MGNSWSDYETHKILKRVREIDAVSTSALVPWIRPKAPAFLSKSSHFEWVFKRLKRINKPSDSIFIVQEPLWNLTVDNYGASDWCKVVADLAYLDLPLLIVPYKLA
jgi:hypothetical protein